MPTDTGSTTSRHCSVGDDTVKRVVVVAAGVLIGAVTTAAAVAHDGTSHRAPTHHRLVLTQRAGIPSHVVRHGAVTGTKARRVIRDIGRLRPYPKGSIFNCPNDSGQRWNARIVRGDSTRRVSVGSCGGIVFVSHGGHGSRAFRTNRRFRHDYHAAFATLRPHRDRAPTSVHVSR
jgi:hypothetical protein